MKEHVNFYENLKEAHIRLRGSVVLYEDVPYYIRTITSHKTDGIFRVYMVPLEAVMNIRWPNFLDQLPHDHTAVGTMFDEYLNTPEGKASPIIRKQMNSPHFNKFRPFPLGMCNVSGDAIYVERQPNRKTEQGLIRSMIDTTPLALLQNDKVSKYGLNRDVDIFTPYFRDCILGQYPTVEACIEGLNDPTVINTGVAFHRNFALIRGPLDSLFLAYKTEIVGVLPDRNTQRLVLGHKYGHVLQAVQALNLFPSIT